MKTMYYYDQEVEYLQDIGDSRALILVYGESLADCDGQYYSEDTEIIVEKKRLRDKKITVNKASEEIINQATKTSAEIREMANHEARVTKRDMEKELIDLKKQVKLYIGLEKSLRFMDPEYKYILTKDYNRISIREMKDLKTNDSWSNGGAKFQAIVIRHKSDGKPETFVSRYSDGSGNSAENIIGFYRSEIDAVEDIIPLLEKETKENYPSDNLYNIIQKYHLETRSDILAKYVVKVELQKIDEKRKRKENLLKEIEKSKTELEELK